MLSPPATSTARCLGRLLIARDTWVKTPRSAREAHPPLGTPVCPVCPACLPATLSPEQLQLALLGTSSPLDTLGHEAQRLAWPPEQVSAGLELTTHAGPPLPTAAALAQSMKHHDTQETAQR